MVNIFIGILFAFIGGVSFIDLIQKKKKCTEQTIAIVTEISEEHNSDNGVSQWPIIEYDINGIHFKNKLSTGNGLFQKYNVGKEIKIFYDKENGDNFYCEERYSSSMFWWGLILVIGITFMISPFFYKIEELKGIAWIMGITGAVLIYINTNKIMKANEKKRYCIIKTIAIVKEIVVEENKSENGKISLKKYPVLKYEANGKQIETKITDGGSISDYSVNQKVEIFYNPNKNDEIYIEQEKEKNMHIVVIILGSILILLSIFSILKKV